MKISTGALHVKCNLHLSDYLLLYTQYCLYWLLLYTNNTFPIDFQDISMVPLIHILHLSVFSFLELIYFLMTLRPATAHPSISIYPHALQHVQGGSPERLNLSSLLAFLHPPHIITSLQTPQGFISWLFVSVDIHIIKTLHVESHQQDLSLVYPWWFIAAFVMLLCRYTLTWYYFY